MDVAPVGERGYEVWWKPLLIGKFGEYYREVNMAWFWARIHKRTPRLGYFVGGFQALLDVLAERVRAQGADVRLNAVPHIESERRCGPPDGVAWWFERRRGERATSGSSRPSRPACSPGWCPPARPITWRAKEAQSMGAVVLILALKQQLTEGHYWINLPKGEGFPFLGLVEHTNFIDPEHYGGDHLVYCGDYLKPDHEYFSLSQDGAAGALFAGPDPFQPGLQTRLGARSWLFREKYAQPVPPVNHSRNIPDLATPIPGLYWASMSQVLSVGSRDELRSRNGPRGGPAGIGGSVTVGVGRRLPWVVHSGNGSAVAYCCGRGGAMDARVWVCSVAQRPNGGDFAVPISREHEARHHCVLIITRRTFHPLRIPLKHVYPKINQKVHDNPVRLWYAGQ